VLIDLHAHSTGSDGTDSPAGLVAAARAAGLDAIALTDHDTTAGWAEAATAVREAAPGGQGGQSGHAFADLLARAAEAGLAPVRLPGLAALERGSDLAAVAAAAASGAAPRTLDVLRAMEAA